MIPAPIMLIDTTTPIPGLKKAHIVPAITLTIPNRTEIKTLSTTWLRILETLEYLIKQAKHNN